MKKYPFYLFFLVGSMLFGEGNEFNLTITQRQAEVIEELVETMANTSTFALFFKKGHLKELAKNLRPVSSTQFLGYVFKYPHLINSMKTILKSKPKWEGLTKSIIRGLEKEFASNLFDILPAFAEFTNGDLDILTILTERKEFNNFIVHLVEQN